MELQLKGYHGTSSDSALKIINSNYVLSNGEEHWLGDGVYFFIEGLSTKPDFQAEKWAIAQSWDNEKQIYKYHHYCVRANALKT